jgi:hypothetical protein
MTPPHDEETLARLLRSLPPAPPAWVEAAAALPELRGQLDGLVARAERDAEFREQVLADLDAAVRAAGLTPDAPALAALRARLDGDAPR